MIITESESNESKASTVHSGGSEAPASPPPYTPSLPAQSQYNSDHKPLPTPPFSPPEGSMSDPNAGPAPRADLLPRCNYLIANNHNSSVKGVWHIDTALAIPDALLAPLEDFDGVWNENDQNRRKKDKKGKRSSDSVPTVSSVAAVRPNLMLKSKNGSVSGEVHVVSSDGVSRPALVVAEGHNGSVTLEVRTHAEQPLRIFATSENGSVRLRIPQSFEGAVTMSTRNGTVKFSDPLKARLTTFSAASSTTRGFIGDWQAANFGSVPASPAPSSDPNADPPLPTTPSDPFTTWTGPLVHLASHNGSVHLSFSDEEPEAGTGGGTGFSNTFRGFMSGLFGGGGGGGGQGDDRGDGGGMGRGRGMDMGMGGGPWGPGGGPWSHGGGPFGRGGGPFSPGNVPFAPGGMPFAPGGGPFEPGGGPFGRGGGPFACGGGPFARGGGSPSNMREYERGRRGSFGRQSGSSCRSRREDGPQDQEAPGYDGKSWFEPENENGYPMDKKGPI